jgi:hypothetical protein
MANNKIKINHAKQHFPPDTNRKEIQDSLLLLAHHLTDNQDIGQARQSTQEQE